MSSTRTDYILVYSRPCCKELISTYKKNKKISSLQLISLLHGSVRCWDRLVWICSAVMLVWVLLLLRLVDWLRCARFECCCLELELFLANWTELNWFIAKNCSKFSIYDEKKKWRVASVFQFAIGFLALWFGWVASVYHIISVSYPLLTLPTNREVEI